MSVCAVCGCVHMCVCTCVLGVDVCICVYAHVCWVWMYVHMCAVCECVHMCAGCGCVCACVLGVDVCAHVCWVWMCTHVCGSAYAPAPCVETKGGCPVSHSHPLPYPVEIGPPIKPGAWHFLARLHGRQALANLLFLPGRAGATGIHGC